MEWEGESDQVEKDLRAAHEIFKGEPCKKGEEGSAWKVRAVLEQIRPFDVQFVLGSIKGSDETGKAIHGKDVVLPLGPTGVGKSMLICLLAGAKMRRNSRRRIECNHSDNEHLEAIKIGHSGQSETHHVAKVPVKVEGPEGSDDGQREVVLCDTPGFNDKRGVAFDVTGTVGLFRAVKGCQSVYPVLVLDYHQCVGGRFETMEKMIEMLSRIAPSLGESASRFSFIFNKSRGTEDEREDLKESVNQSLKLLSGTSSKILKEIQKQLKNGQAIFLYPLREGEGPAVLSQILKKPAIERPRDFFRVAVTEHSSELIKRQMECNKISVTNALGRKNYPLAVFKINQLERLSEVLEGEISHVVESKLQVCLGQLGKYLSEIATAQKDKLKACLEERGPLSGEALEQYNKCLADYARCMRDQAFVRENLSEQQLEAMGFDCCSLSTFAEEKAKELVGRLKGMGEGVSNSAFDFDLKRLWHLKERLHGSGSCWVMCKEFITFAKEEVEEIKNCLSGNPNFNQAWWRVERVLRIRRFFCSKVSPEKMEEAQSQRVDHEQALSLTEGVDDTARLRAIRKGKAKAPEQGMESESVEGVCETAGECQRQLKMVSEPVLKLAFNEGFNAASGTLLAVVREMKPEKTSEAEASVVVSTPYRVHPLKKMFIRRVKKAFINRSRVAPEESSSGAINGGETGEAEQLLNSDDLEALMEPLSFVQNLVKLRYGLQLAGETEETIVEIGDDEWSRVRENFSAELRTFSGELRDLCVEIEKGFNYELSYLASLKKDCERRDPHSLLSKFDRGRLEQFNCFMEIIKVCGGLQNKLITILRCHDDFKLEELSSYEDKSRKLNGVIEAFETAWKKQVEQMGSTQLTLWERRVLAQVQDLSMEHLKAIENVLKSHFTSRVGDLEKERESILITVFGRLLTDAEGLTGPRSNWSEGNCRELNGTLLSLQFLEVSFFARGGEEVQKQLQLLRYVELIGRVENRVKVLGQRVKPIFSSVGGNGELLVEDEDKDRFVKGVAEILRNLQIIKEQISAVPFLEMENKIAGLLKEYNDLKIDGFSTQDRRVELKKRLLEQPGNEGRIGQSIVNGCAYFLMEVLSAFNEKVDVQTIEYVLNGFQRGKLTEQGVQSGLNDNEKGKWQGFYEGFTKEYQKLVGDCLGPGEYEEEHLISKIRTELISKIRTEKDKLATQPNPSASCYHSMPSATRKSLPGLVAQIFALHTVLEYRKLQDPPPWKDYETGKNHLFRPHAIQVLAVFCLLDIDGGESEQLRRHLVQVGTGEGKSLILAVAAAALALLGFEVHCACYSAYLSERDYKVFKGLFEQLGVVSAKTQSVHYGSFYDLCGRFFNEGQGMTAGEKVKRFVSPPETESSRSEVSSAPSSVAAPRRRPRVLLVDEVDVFFDKDFYGKTYSPYILLGKPEAKALVNYIWSHRSGLTFQEVVKTAKYQACCGVYAGFEGLIEEVVKDFLACARNFQPVGYEIEGDSPESNRICIKIQDETSSGWRLRHKTVCAYFYECGRKRITEENRDRHSGLEVISYHFAYTQLPSYFECMMGVSATLDLARWQREFLQKHPCEIHQIVKLPSLFGDSHLKFDTSADVHVERNQDTFFDRIKEEIVGRLEAGCWQRALLIFFESKEKLEACWEKMDELRESQGINMSCTMTESLSREERAREIRSAMEPGRVSFLTSSYGRGIDFVCDHPSVREAGGVHSLQTYLGSHSEEVQVKGRAARCGEKGSYSMVLSQSDLEERFSITSYEIDRAKRIDRAKGPELLSTRVLQRCTTNLFQVKEGANGNLYRVLNEGRNVFFDEQQRSREVAEAKEKHKKSKQLLKYIEDQAVPHAKQILLGFNKSASNETTEPPSNQGSWCVIS